MLGSKIWESSCQRINQLWTESWLIKQFVNFFSKLFLAFFLVGGEIMRANLAHIMVFHDILKNMESV